MLKPSECNALDWLFRQGGTVLISAIPDKNENDGLGEVTPGIRVFKKLEKAGLVIITEEDEFTFSDGDTFTFTPMVELSDDGKRSSNRGRSIIQKDRKVAKLNGVPMSDAMARIFLWCVRSGATLYWGGFGHAYTEDDYTWPVAQIVISKLERAGLLEPHPKQYNHGTRYWVPPAVVEKYKPLLDKPEPKERRDDEGQADEFQCI